MKEKKIRISPKKRIEQIVDEDSYKQDKLVVQTTNFLGFPDYEQTLSNYQQQTGNDEAIITGQATIGGILVEFGVMDPFFMVGSLNISVGEQIGYAINQALELNIPLVLFIASGGARMQEGIFSLLEFPLIQFKFQKLLDKKIPTINILTDPTFGGVSASFAFMAKSILVEEDAQVGFAGRRVIEQTTHEILDNDFQNGDRLIEQKLANKIVATNKVREEIIQEINNQLQEKK